MRGQQCLLGAGTDEELDDGGFEVAFGKGVSYMLVEYRPEAQWRTR